MHGQRRSLSIEITVEPHDRIRGRCSQCHQSAPGYDRLPERRWLFVPLWGIPTYFRYAPRRVECAEHGVVVEHIPWSEGKRPVTCAMMGFLARWARRLSWRETAQVFQTSWEAAERHGGVRNRPFALAPGNRAHSRDGRWTLASRGCGSPR